LKHDIIKFIEYANNVRTRNLKSLLFSKGLKRTDFLNDIKKVVFFLQKFINADENNYLDENNSLIVYPDFVYFFLIVNTNIRFYNILEKLF